jgi:Cupin
VDLKNRMLLSMLPPIVHLRSETDRETLRWVFDRMRQELVDPKPGGFLIVQQLAYMIFVQALRLHLDEGNGVGWLFALSDKHVGAAIAAIHREPARRWTVAALALEVGMRDPVSRHDLGNWSAMDRSNISRARGCCSPAAACRAANPSVQSPARLGYESESAFSTAFKRVMGSTPRHHARLAAGA